MGPKTWSLILKVVGYAVDEALTYIKGKITNGGAHDSTGTGETK